MVTFLAKEKQNARSYTLAWRPGCAGTSSLQTYHSNSYKKKNSHEEGDSGSTQDLFDSDQQRTASSVHGVQRKIFDNRAASAARWTGRQRRSPRLRNALQNRSHQKAEIAVLAAGYPIDTEDHGGMLTWTYKRNASDGWANQIGAKWS